MTVDELIEELQSQSAQGHGSKQVKFSYNYGDHWRTQVAEGVDTVELVGVQHSAYHNMDKVVDEDDAIDPEVKGVRQVVLLN